MYVDLKVGCLTEALSRRHWDRATIGNQFRLRVARYAQAGMCRGDRVFIYFGNNLELFADLLAIWHLGGCAVPIDTRLTAFEIATLAGAAAPRFLLYIETLDTAVSADLAALGVACLDSSQVGGTPPAHLPPSSMTLDQEALILFTSGSTGAPKGVVHTHRSLRARWMTLRQSLGVEKYRRTLCLLPTHFGHGLICNCLYPWLSGQDLIIAPAGNVEVAMRLGSLLDEHAVTFMSSVPPIWRLAIKASRPPKAATLKRVFCGSAPLSAHLWKQIREWSSISDVCNAYGITETGSWVAGTSVEDFEPEDGLVGVPWGAIIKIMKDGSTDQPPGFGVECEPSESGFVWLNTPALMKGYLDRDDLTQAVVSHGWFMTGDIGAIDDRGWLYLRGRERDEINHGGTKIYPADIEAVVERFAEATDVCCFALDDKFYGQAVGMAVVLAQPSAANLNALRDWMKLHLAGFQLPARWYLVDAIPRTARGKVNRVDVAAVCAGLIPVDFGKGAVRPS